MSDERGLPAGHTSAAEDYCDVCGMPIDGRRHRPRRHPRRAPPRRRRPRSRPGQPCPNCRTENAVDALFCENCGYDFTTGTMPRPLDPARGADVTPARWRRPTRGPPTPVPAVDEAAVAPPSAPSAEPAVDWVAEVWIDPAWYAAQESPDPLPSPGLPAVVGLRAKSVLVGRTSQSRNIHPEVDCDTDSGVSRRQAQLTTDGTRWWVEDLDSANGTFVGSASGSLPEDPIAVGVKRELAPDDRVYLGAWTRIVIRAATDEERETLG